MPLASVLSTLAGGVYEALFEPWAETATGHTTLLCILLAFLVIMGTWRALRFTVIPALYPNDPKELPYWIPFLGHLLAFFGNGDNLLTGARRYFGDREAYALTVAGMKTYVLTKPKDVEDAYRNNDTLSYEVFVQEMMLILGNSKASVTAMFQPLPKDKKGFPNPHGKPLGILFRQMHIHQLFPGENLTFLETRFLEFFDKHLYLKQLQETCPYATSQSPGSIVLPLTQWCSDYFVKAGQGAYFGQKLAEIDPTLTDAFIIFDELSYQVIYQYPRFLAKEMQSARDRVLVGLKKYLQLPHEDRIGDAWFVKAMETEMRAIGMSADDMAIATMTIYWAINTNSRKASYWMLAYLLQDPSLLEVVRQETAPAFRADGTVDLDYLHNSVPQLDAMWNEMLRLCSFAASVRFVTDDTMLGGKILRKGTRLIIPYRQLHMNQSAYGESVEQFEYTRFLKEPRLAQSRNFRPFGGGVTMCPGRHIAKRAVFLFTAMVLHRFDAELVGDQRTLEADLTKPVPGLMSPKIGEELLVRFTPRKV